MKLDLRGLEDFPASVSLTAGPERFSPFAEGVIRVRQISVDLTIQKSGEEFFCQAHVVGQVTAECARCLAEIEIELTGRISFIATSEEKLALEAEDNEEYLLLNSEQCADMGELVRQELVVAMPMKPLCAEDCKGLCSHCGVNLNTQTCNCRGGQIDSRWQGLRDLLKDK